MRVPVGRLGSVAIVAWFAAFLVGIATSTAADWNDPWSSWQPVVVLLPVWLFLGGTFIGVPMYGLFWLARELWHTDPVHVTLPVVPRSWSRLSARDRYTECQREIVRLERELGIGE